MTAHIMMWHFLESILSPSAEKKGEAGDSASYHHDQEFVTFLEHDLLPLTEKR